MRAADCNARLAAALVRTVLDDNSRIVPTEVCSDERAETAIGVWARAVARFAERGVTVERVRSDSGPASAFHAWRDACLRPRITPKRTRPYRPQTNGKIERLHRILGSRWARGRFDSSHTPRRQALAS